MTEYKIKINPENGLIRYEVYLGFCTESEKEFSCLDILKKYLKNQERTGRKIGKVIVSGINGQAVEAGELEAELNGIFVKA